MKEEIIDGINYRLDEETLTAEVIHMDGYKGDIIIPETVVHESVSYRVTSIGEDAFAYSDLKSIVIPDTVTYIDGGAFEESHLTSVVIPDSVTMISSHTFESCENLLSLVIGKGITDIFYEVFAGCCALASITYNGTMEQWKQIAFAGDDWNEGVPAKVVHCTDGDVEI
jgi:hypothetical protein